MTSLTLVVPATESDLSVFSSLLPRYAGGLRDHTITVSSPTEAMQHCASIGAVGIVINPDYPQQAQAELIRMASLRGIAVARMEPRGNDHICALLRSSRLVRRYRPSGSGHSCFPLPAMRPNPVS